MNYAAHGQCWLWDWRLILIHATSDSVTFYAYIAIPLYLMYAYRRGKLAKISIAFPKLWLYGAAFIAFCGLSHAGAALEVWFGGWFYYVTGANKVIMACVSIKFLHELRKVVEQIFTMGIIINAVYDEDVEGR